MVSSRFSLQPRPCTDPKDKGAAKADGQTVEAWNRSWNHAWLFPGDPRIAKNSAKLV